MSDPDTADTRNDDAPGSPADDDAPAVGDGSPRLIKKYPNRRIYDTRDSRYITIEEVRAMVVDGVAFKIVDARTGDDITRSVLLRIIIEQESETNPLFSTDNLQNFIRYCGESQQQAFSDFINQSISFFGQQQQQFQDSMQEMLQQNPVKAWSELSRQNLEMWQRMQSALFGQGPGTGKSDQDE